MQFEALKLQHTHILFGQFSSVQLWKCSLFRFSKYPLKLRLSGACVHTQVGFMRFLCLTCVFTCRPQGLWTEPMTFISLMPQQLFDFPDYSYVCNTSCSLSHVAPACFPTPSVHFWCCSDSKPSSEADVSIKQATTTKLQMLYGKLYIAILLTNQLEPCHPNGSLFCRF